MHHPSGDRIKAGIRAFQPLFGGRSCTGMRVNREKDGNTDTLAGWKDFWVASGLSTEGEGSSQVKSPGSCQPGGRLWIRVPGQP